MNEILVSGARPISGKFEPGGSKNAALPIIFAALSICGVSVISRVPDIGDVRVATEIIKRFGADVKRQDNVLYIDASNLHYEKIPRELTSKIRASSYLIGACLARFGMFHLDDFGGCNFCNRPIDMHLSAAAALGADITDDFISVKSLCGSQISFTKPSVGATINALIMAASAKGSTVISGAAREPHVKNLIDFLSSAGAVIEDDGKRLIIKPQPLHGGTISVIPDMIEAGTFLLMAPLTGGVITVGEADNLELESFLSVLSESGVSVSKRNFDITVSGEPKKAFSLITAPHPGFPTDLQPQTAALMAKFFGGDIYEGVWQNRFSYLSVLKAFGVESNSCGSRALVYPSHIRCADAVCPDLRGGAAALLCALSAEGKSKIKNADIIFRGYSELIPKLEKLGAEINILNSEDT